jgi:hypothetical protein
MLTDVSDKVTALMVESVNSCEMSGQYLPDYMVQHPQKQPS